MAASMKCFPSPSQPEPINVNNTSCQAESIILARLIIRYQISQTKYLRDNIIKIYYYNIMMMKKYVVKPM